MSRDQAPLSKSEIVTMKHVCKLAAQTLAHAGKHVKAGISTEDLDKIVHEYTLSTGAIPATLGYHGYPKSICTSINHVVCHGVPKKSDILKDGDIINIDVTSKKDGFYGDCSATFFVGEVSAVARELTSVAKEARDLGIRAIRPNGYTGDIGFEVNKFVQRKGFVTVKEIGGHGIGRIFHGDPFVPSFGRKGKGELLVPWTCITVEPMVNEGTEDFDEIDIPGSSHKEYITADRKLSAQFEHTILITDTGYEILTLDV